MAEEHNPRWVYDPTTGETEPEWFKRLVQAALGDPPDQEALRELARWVHQKAEYYVRKYPGVDPEDVAQEALEKVWKRRKPGGGRKKGVRDHPNPYACCLLILKNTFRDHRRKLGRTPEISSISTAGEEERDLFDSIPGSDLSPDELVALKEEAEELTRRVGKLLATYTNPEYAEYFRLRYVSGMEIVDIAKKFGVPRGQVDVALNRVRAWLRLQFQGGQVEGTAL